MSDGLPEGWATTTLKNLVGQRGMFTDGDWILSEHMKTGNNVRLIQLADVGIGSFLDKSKKSISQMTADLLRVTYLHEGDVLISRMADPLARACLFPRIERPAITAVDVAIARCDGSVAVSAYLMHLCNSQRVLIQAEEVAVGTTRKRISRKNLEQIRVPLPPLNEQHRIVAKLEKLLGKVNVCEKRLAKIPVILKRFRQSVLAAACSGRLTADWREKNTLPLAPSPQGRGKKGAPSQAPSPLEGEGWGEGDGLPEGWSFSTIDKVSESLKYGTSKKCSYEKKGIPVLRIPNIKEGVIDHTDLKYADLPVKELQQICLQPGDILIIRSNGSVSLVGKTALVREAEKNFAYAGYLIRIRPDRSMVLPRYLNLALGSYDVRLQIEVPARSTSGVNNINSDELRALSFNLPPLPEQQELVRRVEALFALADQIEARYMKAKAYVDKLTQSILSKAFRGELVSQDPNDEPASVLLERIRAEKAKSDNKNLKRIIKTHKKK